MIFQFPTLHNHGHQNEDGSRRDKHCCGCWDVKISQDSPLQPYLICNECGEIWLFKIALNAPPGDTPSADGGESLFTPSLNTSSLPQITSIDARVKELEAALETAIRVADEAREEWDKAPSGMKAGKLLIALSDPSLKYRADITAMHAARLSQGSPGQ